MSPRVDPEFERQLTAGLEELAPEPARGLLDRIMSVVASTNQRRGPSLGLRDVAARLRGRGPRSVVVVAVGAAALVIGIVIGSSGLLPSGRTPAPSPSTPASASPVPPAAAGWGSVVIQPHGSQGDVVASHAFAFDGGVVVTGQIAGPLAEELGGVSPAGWYSADGVHWLPSRVGGIGTDIGPVFEVSDRLMAFGYGDDGFGQTTAIRFVSTDAGASWEGTEDILPNAVITDVAAGGPGYVAVGYTPDAPSRAVILSSPDGRTWTRAVMGPRLIFGFLNAVASRDGILVAVGGTYEQADGQPDIGVWTSTDGTRWTHQPQPADEFGALLHDVVAAPEGFVAVGNATDGSPASWWSPDGLAWTRTELDDSMGARTAWAAARVADGFVAVGDGTDHAVAWRSLDGRTWTDAERLGENVAATTVVPLGDAALVVGTTITSPVTGKQPMAWLSPAAAVPAPTLAPTLVPPGPAAEIAGETPGPAETPRPGSRALPGLTLDDLAELAGTLGLTCESGQRLIPDAPDPFWGVVCTGDLPSGSRVTVDSFYMPPANLTHLRVTILSGPTSPAEALRESEAIVATIARLGYDGAQPDVAEAWVRAAMYRAECWVGNCWTSVDSAPLTGLFISPGPRGTSFTISVGRLV